MKNKQRNIPETQQVISDPRTNKFRKPRDRFENKYKTKDTKELRAKRIVCKY